MVIFYRMQLFLKYSLISLQRNNFLETDHELWYAIVYTLFKEVNYLKL